jgi:hypothetical protein
MVSDVLGLNGSVSRPFLNEILATYWQRDCSSNLIL